MGPSRLKFTSLADIMSSHWGHVPKEWLNQTSIHSLRQLCEKLPPISGLGMEIQCGEDLGIADIALRLQQSDVGARAFANGLEGWNYPADYAGNPNWQAIQRFCGFWNAHPLTAAGHLPAAWIEMDAHEWPNEVPNPCLFFGIWNIGRDNLIRSRLIQEAHFIITKTELPRAWFAMLCQLLDRGPEWIERCWIGYMLSRPNSGIRFTVLLPYEDVITVFMDLWGSVPDDLATLFDPQCFRIDSETRYMVHFDCTGQIGLNVGIEIVPLTDAQHIHLAKCGFISIDELERIYRWCGRSEGANELGNVDELPQTPSPGAHLIWTRQMGHYKFVFKPDQPTRLKAYIGASCSWAGATASICRWPAESKTRGSGEPIHPI